MFDLSHHAIAAFKRVMPAPTAVTASEILARHKWTRRQILIGAADHQQVRKIHARRMHIHQHLALAGLRVGKFVEESFRWGRVR